MSRFTADLALLLTRELEAFAREVEAFPNDDAVFKTLPGVTNSAGNLAQHVAGNLRHFVGAVLGGSGYVRDRSAEFTARGTSRAELARELRETAALVGEVLPRLSEEQLAARYPEAVGGIEVPCDRFLLHLLSHLAHHLGQAGYLRRVLTADERSVGPISLKALA